MITIEEQNSHDLDWFMFDRNGNIGHFTTGGCLLPESISSKHTLDSLCSLSSFFDSLANLSEQYEVNPLLTAEKTNDLIRFEEKYGSYISITKKGVFSYDTNEPMNLSNTNYHLITSPVKRIKINDFPEAVKSQLCFCDIEFEQSYTIDIKALEMR